MPLRRKSKKLISSQIRSSFVSFRWFVKDEASKLIDSEVKPTLNFQWPENSGPGYADRMKNLAKNYHKNLPQFWKDLSKITLIDSPGVPINGIIEGDEVTTDTTQVAKN